MDLCSVIRWGEPARAARVEWRALPQSLNEFRRDVLGILNAHGPGSDISRRRDKIASQRLRLTVRSPPSIDRVPHQCTRLARPQVALAPRRYAEKP
nr:hypothetical protein CFP56_00280 [Quercus suber]